MSCQPTSTLSLFLLPDMAGPVVHKKPSNSKLKKPAVVKKKKAASSSLLPAPTISPVLDQTLTSLALPLAAVAAHAIIPTLHPLFGSGPASADVHWLQLALALALAAWPRPLPAYTTATVPLILLSAFGARASHHVRFVGGLSNLLGPHFGPALALAPLHAANALLYAGLWSDFERELPPVLQRGLRGTVAFLGQRAASLALQHVPSHLLPFPGDPFKLLWAIAAASVSILAIRSFFKPLPPPAGRPSQSQATGGSRTLSALTALSLASLLFFGRSSPPKVADHRVLSRVQSSSGLIVVGENHAKGAGYRYLRADHSLLGGRWIGNQALSSSEQGGVGDSIFSAFVLQEAVRFVERNTSSLVEPEKQTALIMCVGSIEIVGVFRADLVPFPQRSRRRHLGSSHDAPPASHHRASRLHLPSFCSLLMLSNAALQVVEYDAGVFSAALEHFNLPFPQGLYIEDADKFVQEAAAKGEEKYDMVIHDVFTGGAVPGELFSLVRDLSQSRRFPVRVLTAFVLSSSRNSGKIFER